MKSAAIARVAGSVIFLGVLLGGAGSGCKSKPRAARASEQALRGQVTRVYGASGLAGLQICDPHGASCGAAEVGSAVPAGSRLKTGAYASALIDLGDDGTIALDHDTELALAAGEPRSAKLVSGSLVASGSPDARFHFDAGAGAVDFTGSKIALKAGADFAILDVIRGAATLRKGSGKPLPVAGGEEARLYRGAEPYVSAGAGLAQAVAFAEAMVAEAGSDSTLRGLGELSAKKPGASDEQPGAVQLAAHSVRVRIAGALSRTEIDEVFENATDDVLEGIYRFPIPPDAKIERLALEVDGKLTDGAFVDRDRAAAIWRGAIVHAAPSARPQMLDEIVWVPGPWRDPALLEWQRGGRFELKIFPIPKRGQRRIVLAYTQLVAPQGGLYRYAYPLPIDPGGSTKIRHFDFDLELRGYDAKTGVRSLGYAAKSTERDGVAALSMHADGFTPNGDVALEWARAGGDAELTAYGYRDPSSQERYAAIALRPKLPKTRDDRAHATAIIVDSSRSMFGEPFDRARRLAVRLARELDPAGQLTVLACDSRCASLPNGPVAPGPLASQRVKEFLDRVHADGASDPTLAVYAADSALISVGPKLKDIVYIGDGTPTAGPIRPRTVSAAIEQSVRGRVTAVAVGGGADTSTLAALARAGGGAVIPYSPGQTLSEATLGVIAATYGSTLRDVRVELPSGLSAVAPAELATIAAGSEAFLTARMDGDTVDGPLVLRGKVGDQPFEQRYTVHVDASDAAGNAFVPRLYAGYEIADLEQRGSADAKQRAIALSTRYAVASRYTSLLVLESEAMFHAFGLERGAQQAPSFTGEDTAESTEAEGELARAEDKGSSALDELANQAEKKADMSRGAAGGGLAGIGSSGDAFGGGSQTRSAAPPPSPVAPSAAPKAAAPAKPAPRMEAEAEPRDRAFALPPEEPQVIAEPRRRMIPMRRIWERKGAISVDPLLPRAAGLSALAEAERALDREPERRSNLKKVYTLYALSGDVQRATRLVEHWLEKDPLDVDALTARADLAARRGEREDAIRMLGSVIDVRPDDVAAQKRLARLERWSGQPELGCRHSMAIAELRSADAKLLADALRCARGTSLNGWAGDALALADDKTARAADALLAQPAVDDSRLTGDLRVEATWSEPVDLDVAFLHPDGHRVSWLGAPTRELISARDVLSTRGEGLALAGARPGQYVIEVVRARGSGRVHGELSIFVAGETRRVPFTLDGERVSVAIAELKMVPRLVPLSIDFPRAMTAR